jgi:hypothetical protein
MDLVNHLAIRVGWRRVLSLSSLKSSNMVCVFDLGHKVRIDGYSTVSAAKHGLSSCDPWVKGLNSKIAGFLNLTLVFVCQLKGISLVEAVLNEGSFILSFHKICW